MPLHTSIVRDGDTLKLGWTDFHVAAMVLASALDSGQGPWPENTSKGIFGDDKEYDGKGKIGISPASSFTLCNYPVLATTPLTHAGYVLKSSYVFADTMTNEILELKPGDRLIAYRL